MAKPGDRPGCCDLGRAYIAWREGISSFDYSAEVPGWGIELAGFTASRIFPVSYCPWCGAWLAGLSVAAAAKEG